jgi:hypothetical protein
MTVRALLTMAAFAAPDRAMAIINGDPAAATQL